MQNPSDKALDMINDAIRENMPEIGVENNGIGSYEFWGAVGFDAGQDIPYVNEENRTVKIPRDGFSVADISEIVYELIARTQTITFYYETKYDTESFECSYTINGFFLTETTMDFFIVWDEEIN